MSTRGLEIRVLAHQAEAVPILLEEVRAVLAAERRPLVGFATGTTFAAFLQALDGELRDGHLADRLLATHLDEYVGYRPDQALGMVHELGQHCPRLAAMLARGTFFPVPSSGEDATLCAHEQRLERAGGVRLQLLGIGRNGHLAFNEPGTPFDRGFHVATLAPTTRDDARPRFRPAEPPTHAVTAGLATILHAQRILLCAFGKAKSAAVAAMVRGEVTTACPASVLRQHGNVLVLLDPEAARGLEAAAACP